MNKISKQQAVKLKLKFGVQTGLVLFLSELDRGYL